VVNGVTFELAPSTVAPGAIFNIYGFNLAPVVVAASAVPLPTSLGSPGVEVLVNGRLAPLYFVSPGQINAQVPWETEAGQTQVVVRRGGSSSRPAILMVQPAEPSLFALSGAGFGPAIAVRGTNGRLVGADNPPAPGEVVILYASGLGPVDPPVPTGGTGSIAVLSRATRPQRALLNGVPAGVQFAGVAPGFVGLFQINLQLPETYSPGDVVQYFSGPRMANRLTLGAAGTPRARFIALPEGMDNLLGVADANLRGGFVAIAGPRGTDGCYQNVYLVDFARNRTVRVEECLIHANPNAPTPFVSENASSRLAALIGPAAGSPPAGISSRVLIADGITGRTTIVELPAAALNLVPAAADQQGLIATLPGDPPRLAAINPVTGEVQTGAGGAGAGQGALIPSVNIDGLTQIVSTIARLGANRLVVVVADSETNPQRAVFVVLSNTGEVQGRADFPNDYLPLLPPRPLAPGPGGAPPGGGPGQLPGPIAPPGGALLAPRAAAVGDPATNRVVLLARNRDNSRHAVVVFDAAGTTARASDLPSGVFAANCSPQFRLLPLTLTGKLAFPVSDRNESAATNPCAGTGLAVFDGGSIQRATLPENGTLDVNSLNILNDYLYGVNADRLSQNASSVFVYDGVTDSMRKLDVPRGATAFAGLQPIAATGQLLAVASNRTPGDEGLILFDLASGTSRLFAVPEGFARLANPGMHLATRKVTARAFRTAGDGSQVVVFDPISAAVAALPNPAQVQGLGGPAAPAPGAGAGVRIIFERNQNTNSILASAYGPGDRLIGLVLLEAF
jgi:uncharacterized protein (TIGR03437 family)